MNEPQKFTDATDTRAATTERENTMETEKEYAADRLELIRAAGITADYTFIPFNQSRNCKDPAASWWEEPNWPSLNWRVVLKVNGKPALITDYSAGIGHIPGYRPTFGKGMTVYEAGVLSETLETGRVPRHQKPHIAKPGVIPDPSIENVLHSLLSDGAVDFDALSFEEFAAEFGYSEDSRDAERIYHACVDTGRQMRAALGIPMIEKLREAFQDY